MFERWGTPLWVVAPFAAGVCVARPAAAEPAVRACIAEHADGQVLRHRGALLAAREKFRACVQEPCPAVIQTECAAFASEVDAALPSVVPVALGPHNEEIAVFSVQIDDGPALEPRDGMALPLDPGQHRFVFKLPDGQSQPVATTLREGEKYRRVEARFAARESAHTSGVNPLAFVFGGLGAAATASFVYFALDGRASEKRLDRCAPNCVEADVRGDIDDMRRSYLVADISAGVALVSFGLGTYFLLKGPARSQAAVAAPLRFGATFAPGAARFVAAGSF